MVKSQSPVPKRKDTWPLFKFKQNSLLVRHAKLSKVRRLRQSIEADHSRIKVQRALKIGHNQSDPPHARGLQHKRWFRLFRQ